MLKIENHEFKIKSTELNFKQRNYKGESIVTVQIMVEFFPSLVKDNIVSGTIEIKLDSNKIKGIKDIENKTFKGDIGNVMIAALNNGNFEYKSKDEFEISFKEKNNRNINFTLKLDNCLLETDATMVSLYTTSTSKDDLKDKFDLTDFYDTYIEKEIGKNKILKFFVKEI